MWHPRSCHLTPTLIAFYILLSQPRGIVGQEPPFPGAQPCFDEATTEAGCDNSSTEVFNVCACNNDGGWLDLSAACIAREFEDDLTTIYDALAANCAGSNTPIVYSIDQWREAAAGGSEPPAPPPPPPEDTEEDPGPPPATEAPSAEPTPTPAPTEEAPNEEAPTSATETAAPTSEVITSGGTIITVAPSRPSDSASPTSRTSGSIPESTDTSSADSPGPGEGGGSGLGTGVIVGIVVGVVIALLLLAALIFFLRKRRKRHSHDPATSPCSECAPVTKRPPSVATVGSEAISRPSYHDFPDSPAQHQFAWPNQEMAELPGHPSTMAHELPASIPEDR